MMTSYRTIENLRPRDLNEVAPDWEQRQAEILRNITDPSRVVTMAGRPAKLRRRTVLRVGIAAAAAALVVAGVAPIALPHGSPQARADLEVLAESARTADPLTIGPGQYLYRRTEEEQRGFPLNYPDPDKGLPPQDPSGTRRHELWQAQDGSITVRVTEDSSVWLDGPYPQQDSPTGSDKHASMPRSPAELERWLRARVSGSLTNDEAVFVALTDILRTNNPDPELRAVMIETLPRISHVIVETGQHDSLGRPAVIISRMEPLREGATVHYFFNPTTGRYLEERATRLPEGSPGELFYRGTRVEERIVDSRPR